MTQATDHVGVRGGGDYPSLMRASVEQDRDWGIYPTDLFGGRVHANRLAASRSPSSSSERQGPRVPVRGAAVQMRYDSDSNSGYSSSTTTGVLRPTSYCTSWGSVERSRLAPSEVRWADELERGEATRDTRKTPAARRSHRRHFSGRFPRMLHLSLRAKLNSSQNESKETLSRSRSAELKHQSPLLTSSQTPEPLNEVKFDASVRRLRGLFEQKISPSSPRHVSAAGDIAGVKAAPTSGGSARWVTQGRGGHEESDYETPEKILQRMSEERKPAGAETPTTTTTPRPTVFISSSSRSSTRPRFQTPTAEMEPMERPWRLLTERRSQEQATAATSNREKTRVKALSDAEGSTHERHGVRGAHNGRDGPLISALSDVEEARRDLTQFWSKMERPRLPLAELISQRELTPAQRATITSSYLLQKSRDETLTGETLATFLQKQTTEEKTCQDVATPTDRNPGIFQTPCPTQFECVTADAGQKTPCGGTGGPTRARTTLRRRGHRVPGPTGDGQDKRLAVLLYDEDVIYRKDYGPIDDLNDFICSPTVKDVHSGDAKRIEQSMNVHLTDTVPPFKQHTGDYLMGTNANSDKSSEDLSLPEASGRCSSKERPPATADELLQSDPSFSTLCEQKERAIRLSLISAPKLQIPTDQRPATYMQQQLEDREETPPGSCGGPPSDSGIWGGGTTAGAGGVTTTGTAGSNRSSQDSTIFSYPWDLPPLLTAQLPDSREATPNAHSPTSSDTTHSIERARWVTLHRHVTSSSGSDAATGFAATATTGDSPVLPPATTTTVVTSTTAATTTDLRSNSQSPSLTLDDPASMTDGLTVSSSGSAVSPTATAVGGSSEIQAPLYASASPDSEWPPGGFVASRDKKERTGPSKLQSRMQKSEAEEEVEGPYASTTAQPLPEINKSSQLPVGAFAEGTDFSAYHHYAVVETPQTEGPQELIIHEATSIPNRLCELDFLELEPQKPQAVSATLGGFLFGKMKLWKSNRGNGQQQHQENEDRKHQVTNENEASDLDFYERIDVATTSRVESSTKPDAVVDKGIGSRRLDNVWLLPDIPFSSEEISGLHGVETAERVRSFPLPPTPEEREVNAPGHHIRDFVYALANDGECAFSKQVLTFIDCIKQRGYCNPQVTMQGVRQFMSGLINYLQNTPLNGIDAALKAEREELRDLTYLNVNKELEKVIQELILRPLHHHLIQEIMDFRIRNSTVRSASQFSERVLKEYDRLCDTGDQALVKSHLLDPVVTNFNDMQHTFRPEKKINSLNKMLKIIDEFVQQPQANVSYKQLIYAMVLALSCLLVTSTSTDMLSPIDVQRRYIEGLLTRQYLQTNLEACRRLTDLACALRCTEPSALVISEAILALKSAALACELSPFNRRRRGHSLQPELSGHTSSPPSSSSKMTKSHTQTFPTPCLDSVASRTGKGLSEDLDTPVVLLAVDEEVSQFTLQDLPLRPSITVRELCNLLAQQMSIFDPKEFCLFLRVEDDDILLEDSLRLEQVLQRYAERRTISSSLDNLSGMTHPVGCPIAKPSTVSHKTFSRCIPSPSFLRGRSDPVPICPLSGSTGGLHFTFRGCDSTEDLSLPEQRTRSSELQPSLLVFIYRRRHDLLVSAKDIISYCIGVRQVRMKTR